MSDHHIQQMGLKFIDKILNHRLNEIGRLTEDIKTIKEENRGIPNLFSKNATI